MQRGKRIVGAPSSASRPGGDQAMQTARDAALRQRRRAMMMQTASDVMRRSDIWCRPRVRCGAPGDAGRHPTTSVLHLMRTGVHETATYAVWDCTFCMPSNSYRHTSFEQG
jgi:hypothetical protein